MMNRQMIFSYIAGLVDGEGYIIFCQVGSGKKRRSRAGTRTPFGFYPAAYGARFGIGLADFPLLKFVQKYLGGKMKTQIPKSSKHKPQHSLTFCNRKDILSALKKIYPYLKLKKLRAKYMMEWCKSRLKNCPKPGQNFPYSKREVELTQIVKRLNIKGSNKSKRFPIPFS